MMNLITRSFSKFSPNLRWGFFIALSSILLPLRPVNSAATSNNQHTLIQGQTVDVKGDIVPYVSIISKDTQKFILSDESGQFNFSPPIPWEDSVFVRRIGYEEQILSTDDLFAQDRIILTPTTLSLRAVEVEASADPQTTLATLSKHTKTRGAGTQDHNKVLSRIPGIHIKSYGGPAGISTLSLDGGPSSHTRILVNGIDITSAQNGEADISQLPLPFVESMQYIPFDIAGNGNGGIDGIIKLQTGDQQNHINLSGGSYGHQAGDIFIRKKLFGFWTSLQFGQRREAGNYPVTWDGDSWQRRNNDLDQQFYAVSIKKMIRPDLYLLLSTMRSEQQRGVAGLVWSEDLISHRSDNLQLTGSTLGWIHETGATHLRMSIRNSSDDNHNPQFHIRSEHDLDSYNLYLTDDRDIGEIMELYTDISLFDDRISSSATGKHHRRSYTVALSPIIKFPLGVRLTPSLKYHRSPDLYEKTLRGVQVQIPVNIGPLTQLAASQGEVFRYPSFNDLFWYPGGNPNLLPEETDVTTFQAGLTFGNWGDIQLQWQKKESAHLIQWIPTLSYWKPINVQSASRESSKAIWMGEFPTLDLSAFAHYSHIHTRNNNMNSEPLVYSPNKTAAFGVTWAPSQLELNLQYNYLSDRISSYDYPTHIILPAMETWSVSIANTWQSRFANMTLVLSIDNAMDVEYETIKGYPEPGRSFRISMNLAR